jgi:hypothetical protein
MADYGYMDVTVTCPTHGAYTKTIRVFGKDGDTVRRIVEDETNSDFFIVEVVVTVSGSPTSYVID